MIFATLLTIAHQAPLSIGLSRQENWSELSFPAPGDPPVRGIQPESPALAGRHFTTEPPRKPREAGCLRKDSMRMPPKQRLGFLLQCVCSSSFSHLPLSEVHAVLSHSAFQAHSLPSNWALSIHSCSSNVFCSLPCNQLQILLNAIKCYYPTLNVTNTILKGLFSFQCLIFQVL